MSQDNNDLRFIDIPKITNDTIFEELTKDILVANTTFEHVNLNGRSGQKQEGVDVYARKVANSKWIGIQCKVRSKNKSFTKKELLHEINEAKKFNPSLSEYHIYTTLNRDRKTQEIEREINIDLKTNKAFKFKILYWEDIENLLKLPQNETVYYRYYHKYFADNKILGHAIGKLVNMELQFDYKSDTHYEFIIGKIPDHKSTKGHSVDYFRNTYFIVNLLNRRMETFRTDNKTHHAQCFPSDIEYAFDTKIDSYRISKWLSSIENIDNFIYDNEHDYKFSITEKERIAYFKDDD